MDTSTPRLLLAALVIAGWLPMVARLDAPRRRSVSRVDELLLACTWMLCILLTALTARNLVLADPGVGLRIAAGIGMQWGAMCAWSWARATMGASFTQIGAAADLEVRGPYRHVRHPMYASTLAATLGIATAGGHLYGFVTWGALGIVLVVRAVREEVQLHRQFGARWDAYARRSLGLVRDRTVSQAIAHAEIRSTPCGKARKPAEKDA